MSLEGSIPRWRDPEIVGKPCRRPSCGDGEGLHDEEGCTFCKCGYFLRADLMTEVQMVSVWRNRVVRHDDAALYGWLRAFEGYNHEQALALIHGRESRGYTKDRRARQEAALDSLV